MLKASTSPPSLTVFNEKYEIHALEYAIEDASSHSHPYSPEGILVDQPMNSESRWSAEITKPGETWILLNLKESSVVSSITFGKYHKTHPCNLSEFKVMLGASPEHMHEVLHHRLENDSVPQTFSLYDIWGKDIQPSRFVKILPLSSQMPKYHASIWHVSLHGSSDPSLIRKLTDSLQDTREREATRLILKHLRERQLLRAYTAVLEDTGVQLEDPLVSLLYEAVVDHGSHVEAESVLRDLGAHGHFKTYLSSCTPRVHWQRIAHERDASGHILLDAPCRRGGHTMCIDQDRGIAYLLGGWDGARELPDFWSYDIESGKWRILSLHTRAHSGPGPRSCHAMVFDPRNGAIYVLGRYVDPGDGQRDATNGVPNGGAEQGEPKRMPSPPPPQPPSDMFCYMTRGKNAGQWERLSADTAAEGGPQLVFDHQIVIDSDSQRLYMFGGEIVGTTRQKRYSGMYCYDLVARKWTLLFDDKSPILSRHGHSMVLDPCTKIIYIFLGFRNGKALTDMWEYSLAKNEARLVSRYIKASGGPEAGFSQRAVYDTEVGEIRVLLGIMHSSGNEQDTLNLSSWAYRTSSGLWIRLANAEQEPEQTVSSSSAARTNGKRKRGSYVPRPRYGHQIVYDSNRKMHLMFGGNPGKGKRLDDLWSMRLERPSVDQALRKCQFLTRRQSFIELCDTADVAKALTFLHSTVGPVVNHRDPVESAEYHSLMEHILRMGPGGPRVHAEDIVMSDSDLDGANVAERPTEPPPPSSGGMQPNPAVFRQRTKLFEDLLAFIDSGAKQPSRDLLMSLF